MIFTIHIIPYLRGHVQVSDETLMMGVIAPLAGRLRGFVNTPLQFKMNTIRLFNSSPWKDPPFFRTVNHRFRLGPSAWQTVSQNQRVCSNKKGAS